MWSRWQWFACLLAAVGCTNGPSNVVGIIQHRFIGQQPPRLVPVDLSSYRFQIYVEDAGVNGGFAAYPATGPVAGTADGSFEIADVPAGSFWVRMTRGGGYPVFDHEHDHAIRWTWDVLGRPDAVPATVPTPLTINASGLASWDPADQLIASCWTNASESYSIILTPPLTTGATEINSAFDWASGYSWGPGSGPYLMDAERDEDFVLSRITTATTDGVEVATLTQVLTAPAVTQVDGQPASVSGVFTDVALADNVTFTIDRDRVQAALPSGTVATRFTASLLSGPGISAGLLLGPALVSATTTESAGSLSVVASFGRPFDPSWPVFADGVVWIKPIAHDGVSFPAMLRHSVHLVGGGYTFVMPPIAQAPTLKGVPLDGQPVSWDGASALELDLGVTGEITSASVLVVSADDLTYPIAAIRSDTERLIVPPELLRVGATYVFRLGAWNELDDAPPSGSYVLSPPVHLVP